MLPGYFCQLRCTLQRHSVSSSPIRHAAASRPGTGWQPAPWRRQRSGAAAAAAEPSPTAAQRSRWRQRVRFRAGCQNVKTRILPSVRTVAMSQLSRRQSRERNAPERAPIRDVSGQLHCACCWCGPQSISSREQRPSRNMLWRRCRGDQAAEDGHRAGGGGALAASSFRGRWRRRCSFSQGTAGGCGANAAAAAAAWEAAADVAAAAAAAPAGRYRAAPAGAAAARGAAGAAAVLCGKRTHLCSTLSSSSIPCSCCKSPHEVCLWSSARRACSPGGCVQPGAGG